MVVFTATLGIGWHSQLPLAALGLLELPVQSIQTRNLELCLHEKHLPPSLRPTHGAFQMLGNNAELTPVVRNFILTGQRYKENLIILFS